MRAGIAERDQHIRVGQVLRHPLDIDIELRQHEFDVEIVFQGQVEEGVEPVLAALPGDVADAAALIALQLRLLRLVHGDAPPIAAEPAGAFQFVAEGVAERRVGIDLTLRLLGLVGEHPAPALEGGEGERVAHIDFAGQCQGRGLRHRAGVGAGAPACFRTSLGEVVALEQRQERHRPPALGEQHRQQLFFLVVHQPDGLGQRDLDRALAALVQHIAIRLQLLAAGVAAGQRPSLMAEMLVQHGGRKTEGAGIDRFAKQV